MCDCYTTGCKNCGCDISIHIADFCTPRDTVVAFCSRCTKKIVRGKLKPPAGWKVFDATAEISYPRNFHLHKGGKVKLYCRDHKAYGIHLN